MRVTWRTETDTARARRLAALVFGPDLRDEGGATGADEAAASPSQSEGVS